MAYAQLGEREQALANLRRTIAEEPEGHNPQFLIGIVYEILNERDEALKWIAKALTNGLDPGIVENDPWLKTLAADPRYRRLLPQEGPST